MAKKQVSIRLEEDLIKKLNKLAKAEIRDLAGIIRKLLTEAVRNVK